MTPIGLTSAQMKTSNPDAITVIQSEATQSNNDRIAALAKEFAGDFELLAKAIADPKMTVASVKAERYDALQAKVKTLETENTTLKQTGVVGFAASDKPVAAVSANEGEAFEALATEYWNKNEKVRAEFGGIFTDFRADFKHNRDDYK